MRDVRKQAELGRHIGICATHFDQRIGQFLHNAITTFYNSGNNLDRLFYMSDNELNEVVTSYARQQSAASKS